MNTKHEPGAAPTSGWSDLGIGIIDTPPPTITWAVDADGNWATASDWSLDRLPNSTDNVSINTADLHTITHSKGTDTVNTLTVGNDDFVVSGGSLAIESTAKFAHGLTVSGGTLALGGNAKVNSFSQTGGVLSGAETLTVTGAATFNGYKQVETGSGVTLFKGVATLAENAAIYLDGGRTLENQGTLNVSLQATIGLGKNPLGVVLGGATLQNDAGGTLILGGAAYIAHGKGSVSFTNAGTIEEQAGGSGATVGVTLTNTGQILAQAGELALFGFVDKGPGTVQISSGAGVTVFYGGSAAAAAFTVDSGGYLDFSSNSIGDPQTTGVFSLGAGTVAGTGTVGLLGPGTLALGSGDVKIDNFTQTAGTVSGSGTLTLTGVADLAGDLAPDLNAVESGPGRTLLTASSTFFLGSHLGGSFDIVGGRFLENQGGKGILAGTIQLGDSRGGTLENDAGGSLTFEGVVGIQGFDSSFVNAGSFEKLKIIREHNPPDTTVATIGANFTDTGVVIIDGGFLEFFGQVNTFEGAISGAGGIIFGGGVNALNSGAISTGSLAVSGSAVVNLNANLNYSGAFSLTEGGALNVAAGDTVSFRGKSKLDATIGGAGTVTVAKATLSGLTIAGGALLTVSGTAVQKGAVTVGDASGKAATLQIDAGAQYTIESGSDIARGQSLASTLIDNGRLINAAGAGTTVIGVAIVDSGAIEAAGGTLDLTQAITGAGALTIAAGATLQAGFSAAASLTATFNGAGATLALGNPAQFAATIAGFAANDTIQLVGRQATSATLESGDTLAITDGGNAVATLQLAGNYAGDVFSVASDGAGGSIVTVAAAAAGQRFIAAMAGLGASGGASIDAAGPPRAEVHPALSTPAP